MSRPAVVIAEDEPRILRSIAFIVEREGGRAVGAGDGVEALEAIRRERPVLAVVDVMMPRQSGLELTRELRADPAFECLPILILTAVSQPETEAEAMAAGATLFLRKPFDPRALRELLVSYLRG
ncbi:MAG: response regulator [Armatimonadetes bacterium]|nr:response regulator [Armatimonadota bacterium]